MKKMRNFKFGPFAFCLLNFIAGLLLMIFVAFCIYGFQPPEEIETYTEGYEISHMEISRGRCYISARNDTDSFTIKVDGETFGRHTEGEVVEVEVQVMEYHEKIFNEYTILGLDK